MRSGSISLVERRWRGPEGSRIYVVGDIHGRDDLLCELHGMIRDDASNTADLRCVVIYLGDYVDRGPRSADVLDRLVRQPLEGFTALHLMGNHEEMMLNFIDRGDDGLWLVNGGDATVRSYGIDGEFFYADDFVLADLREKLRAAAPPSHIAFLRSLAVMHTEGEYVFVHAGVRPDRPLELQTQRDLTWIRGPFLVSDVDYGKCVVHGHTIFDKVDVQSNRIGIDTGAFFSGRLTCLVIEGDTRWVLST